jgi:hypothetical protein
MSKEVANFLIIKASYHHAKVIEVKELCGSRSAGAVVPGLTGRRLPFFW